MPWETIEHLLNHEQAVERVQERLNDFPLLIDYAEETCDETDTERLAEGIMNQIYGVEGQFTMVTAEALDAFPHQAYQDFIESEFSDHIYVQDDVANAMLAIEPLNGDVLTYNEVLQTLPYFGVDKPAPILDDYDQQLPTIMAKHEGDMNETQEQYNALSSEQRQFLASASEGTGRTLIVDSTQEFAHGSAQFRSDNEFMKSPYTFEENARVISELFDLPYEPETFQL